MAAGHTARRNAHDPSSVVPDGEGEQRVSPDDSSERRDEETTTRLEIEEFRLEAHRAVDWCADYLGHADRYPVLSRVSPGEVRSLLPKTPPLEPAGLEGVTREMERVVVPGLTHWNSPSFMAYFASTGSPPGVLAELFTAAFNQNGMLWQSSPAATEIEAVVLDWLRQMLGLPDGLFGIVYDTASISTLCAMAAARERAYPDGRFLGLAGGPRLVAYTSQEAHSVVDKAAIGLGIGQDNLRKVAVDGRFRMDVEALSGAIESDLKAGLMPFCVVATVGTTSTTSIDPVCEIAAVCEKHGLWLHVDAAYGGAAAILPEMRWVLNGCDRADSICVNAHKWLFVPMDFSAFYTRHPEVLKRAFSLVRPYLETPHDGCVTNLMDYGPQLGRRFRALKLWLTIRAYGVAGIQRIVRRHIQLAAELESWIQATSSFEVMAPRNFSTICFRAHPEGMPETELNGMNEKLLRMVNSSGEVFLSRTVLEGRLVLRLAIGHMLTTASHVRRAQEILEAGLADGGLRGPLDGVSVVSDSVSSGKDRV